MEFIDLGAQQSRIKHKIDARIQDVLAHGKYIMGPEVAELEKGLSAFCGSPLQALTCSNGTDAISLVLMALGIGPGDAVFVPSFTFAATAEVVALQRATPVFTDVLADTFNMDPESLKKAISVANAKGLKPKAVITVDLFGQPADYDAIEAIAREHGLQLICDAAQGFGGVYKGRKVGTIGLATTTSFFPAKPLGCYGDGGAVFTADKTLDDTMKSLRVHGKGTDKYDNARVGLNARLDTLQAGILIEKLAIFADEIEARNRVADRYARAFAGHNEIIAPKVLDGCVSSWAQYTLRLPASKRDALAAALGKQGVPTVVYYPLPLHMQNAYKMHPGAGDISTSERLSKEVLSLPMHPYLDEATQDQVIASVISVMATV
jgi:dTDP-4-amino-4,6-dideoxygalactose transaminase